MAIGRDRAGFEAIDAGADDEGALAPLVDRALDLALQFAEVVGEILRQRVSDERGEALAASEHDQEVAAHAIGIAVDDEVGEMHLGRRSEERRGGKEGVSTCRSRWLPT